MNDSNAALNSTGEDEQQKPRMWMFIAWLGIVGLGVLALVAAVVIGLGGGMNSVISALEKEGQPTSLADLKAEYDQKPRDNNAAVALDALLPEITAALKQIGPVMNSRKLAETPYAPDQMANADMFVTEHEELFDKITEAIRMQHYAPTIETDADNAIDEVLNRSGHCRQLARLLRLRAEVLVHRGDMNKAAEAGLDIIRYGDHLENAPTLTGYLVSIAVRQFGGMTLNEAFQSGEVSAETRGRIRDDLGKVDLVPGFINALRTERALAIDRTRNAGGSFAMTRLLRPLLKDMDLWIKATEKDGLEWSTAPAGAPQAATPTRAVHTAAIRWKAHVRMLKILEAVTARGGENANLESLELEEEDLIDPFAAPNRLQLKRENGGWTIYSVGANGEDDGGNGDDPVFRAPQKVEPKK